VTRDLLVTIKRAMELKRLYEENEFLKAQNKELLQQIKVA